MNAWVRTEGNECLLKLDSLFSHPSEALRDLLGFRSEHALWFRFEVGGFLALGFGFRFAA